MRAKPHKMPIIDNLHSLLIINTFANVQIIDCPPAAAYYKVASTMYIQYPLSVLLLTLLCSFLPIIVVLHNFDASKYAVVNYLHGF